MSSEEFMPKEVKQIKSILRKEGIMENIIFCFSGTGNSLAVAQDFAKQTGNTKIVLIADMMREELINLPYERRGIVCPAYFSSLSPIIEQFVKSWVSVKQNMFMQ